MFINVGLNRTVIIPIGNQGKTKKKEEHKSVKIDIGDLEFSDTTAILEIITKENPDWSVSGWFPSKTEVE